MKRLILTLSMLLSIGSSLLASNINPTPDDEDIIIFPVVGHVLDHEGFGQLIPYVHMVTSNGNGHHTLLKEEITLDTLTKAQRMGWIFFHLTKSNAKDFAERHWRFALTLMWPSTATQILDAAYVLSQIVPRPSCGADSF